METFEITKQSYLWGLIKKETRLPKSVASTGVKNGIIAQIIGEFKDRTRSNIQKWREAIQATEDIDNPRWFLLQDLYDNLMTDGHLMALLTIRKTAVTGNRFYIMDKNGEENTEATDQLQTEWFYNLMDNWLDSIYRKYSITELIDPVAMKWVTVPYRNICPKKQRIYFEVMGDKFVNYTDPKFQRNLLFVENHHPFGILNDIIPQLIWKRNAQQVWADLSERFGIPMVTAETMTTDKKVLDQVESAMNELGQAAHAILPSGTTITIHDGSTKGDPHNIFNEQIKTTNSEMSKRIVGGTMISDEGSSRSQSEVHERTLDNKIAEADRRMVEFTVNNKLIPMLRMHGFRFNDTDRFVFDRSEELTMKEHWGIVQGVINSYEVDEQWLSKTFNVPITGKKEAVQPFGLSSNFR